MTKTIYENWGGHPVKLTWIPSKQLPDLQKITSVHGFCFDKDKVLLVHIPKSGYNTPGGHVETGESPEDSFHREAYEEGYVKGNLTLLGMIEVSHEENPLFDITGKYPLIGYQVFYRMNITECLPFMGEHEADSRIWVEADQVERVINDHTLSLVILEEAIRKNSEK